MNRPLSRLATRAAHGASQLPRISWYLGHSLAMTRIAQRAREDGSARPPPYRRANSGPQTILRRHGWLWVASIPSIIGRAGANIDPLENGVCRVIRKGDATSPTDRPLRKARCGQGTCLNWGIQ